MNDATGAAMALGIVGAAERITHEGAAYLLVRLQVQEIRTRPVSRGRGVTEYVPITDPFVPFELACDGAVMEVAGTPVPAHALSVCRTRRRVVAGGGVPVFLVFPYPAAGGVQVRVPVTVLAARGAEAREVVLGALIPK